MKSALPPLLLLLLAGCRNPAPGYMPVAPTPVPQVSASQVQTPTALMPLDEGNRWTFSLQNQAFDKDKPAGTTEITVDFRVSQVASDGSATLVVEQDGKPFDQQVWRSTDTGLYQVASGLRSVRFDPEQPLALLPLTAGRHFTWLGTGLVNDHRGRAKLDSEILAPQNVDTGIGVLSAVPIVTRTVFERGRIENSSWFRPGVGLVRLRQETTTDNGHRDVLLLTLKNYAIKR